MTTWTTLALWAALMGLWAMTVWGGWAEKHFDRVGEASASWYWLRLGGVATSKKNCVRFMKGVALGGMVLVTLGALTILLR